MIDVGGKIMVTTLKCWQIFCHQHHCIQNYDMEFKLDPYRTLIRIRTLDKHFNFRCEWPLYSVRHPSWVLTVCPLYITKMNNGFSVAIRTGNYGKWQNWLAVELKCYQINFRLMEQWYLVTFTTLGKWFKASRKFGDEICWWRFKMEVTNITENSPIHVTDMNRNVTFEKRWNQKP